MTTSDELMGLILNRRTIRHYKPEQISLDELQKILAAGLWVPSAGGRQSLLLLVCQNIEQNERLGRINRSAFGGANSDGIHFVSKTQKSIADDNSINSGFYGAPTVISLFSPERWLYGIHDCSMAAESMSLMAWSLGIGSCYVSRSEETFESDEGKRMMEKAGIEPYYKARVCLCFGYPDGEIGVGKPRKEGRIKWMG